MESSKEEEAKQAMGEVEVYANDTITVYERDTVYIPVKADLSNKFFILSRLPRWVSSHTALSGLEIQGKYILQSRLNPLYLEADFNGDGKMDIALPIKEVEGEKLGIAVLHGGKDECFILGAGVSFENGLSDNLNYVDIWRVNRERVNFPGLDDEGLETLYLDNPSIYIEKSELGGGTIYWKGGRYIYYHQTC